MRKVKYDNLRCESVCAARGVGDVIRRSRSSQPTRFVVFEAKKEAPMSPFLLVRAAGLEGTA